MNNYWSNPKLAEQHFIYPMHVELFDKASEKALSELDKEKFGLVGRIGSTKTNHEKYYDIDNIIVPNVDVPLGDCIIEANKYYRTINDIITKDSNNRLYTALAPKFSFQEEVYELCAQNHPTGHDGQIPIHTLMFVDIKNVISVTCEDFVSRVKEKIVPVYGSADILMRRKVIAPKDLEPHFYIAESQLASNNGLPEYFALRKAKIKLDYLRKNYAVPISEYDISNIKTVNDAYELSRHILLDADSRIAWK